MAWIAGNWRVLVIHSGGVNSLENNLESLSGQNTISDSAFGQPMASWFPSYPVAEATD